MPAPASAMSVGTKRTRMGLVLCPLGGGTARNQTAIGPKWFANRSIAPRIRIWETVDSQSLGSPRLFSVVHIINNAPQVDGRRGAAPFYQEAYSENAFTSPDGPPRPIDQSIPHLSHIFLSHIFFPWSGHRCPIPHPQSSFYWWARFWSCSEPGCSFGTADV